MSFSINTNISALTAQQNLLATSQRISTTVSRLTSGLRINNAGAGDDAAMGRQLQAAAKATSDQAAAELKGQGQEVKDTVSLQNQTKAENAAAEQTRINLQHSQSMIKDADMAVEMASFTKNNIMQQAGTSLMAQASVLPQSALSLLRG